jgi:hypothetical protein
LYTLVSDVKSRAAISRVSKPHSVFSATTSQVARPDTPAQQRHQPHVLVAEEVRGQWRGAQGVWISMTSTPEPGHTNPGQMLATRIASSRLAAVTIM